MICISRLSNLHNNNNNNTGNNENQPNLDSLVNNLFSTENIFNNYNTDNTENQSSDIQGSSNKAKLFNYLRRKFFWYICECDRNNFNSYREYKKNWWGSAYLVLVL